MYLIDPKQKLVEQCDPSFTSMCQLFKDIIWSFSSFWLLTVNEMESLERLALKDNNTIFREQGCYKFRGFPFRIYN